MCWFGMKDTRYTEIKVLLVFYGMNGLLMAIIAHQELSLNLNLTLFLSYWLKTKRKRTEYYRQNALIAFTAFTFCCLYRYCPQAHPFNTLL